MHNRLTKSDLRQQATALEASSLGRIRTAGDGEHDPRCNAYHGHHGQPFNHGQNLQSQAAISDPINLMLIWQKKDHRRFCFTVAQFRRVYHPRLQEKRGWLKPPISMRKRLIQV